MSKKVFLTAEWRKLIMANYTIDRTLLLPYVPAHTELDDFSGQCYVSLVGFLFRDVKVKGISIPWHRHFPEVNLRFYVKHFDGHQWKRGVVFISEIVPKPAITWVANTLYKEHYSTLPMQYSWEKKPVCSTPAINGRRKTNGTGLRLPPLRLHNPCPPAVKPNS